MNIKTAKHRFMKASIASLVLAGCVFLIAPETANAQYRRDDRQIRRVESRNIARIAQAQGYNDGLREGADQIRRKKRYDPYGEGRYKKATNGYKSRFGNKETYKRIYRRAFVRGYNEAYYRNPPRVIRPVRRNW